MSVRTSTAIPAPTTTNPTPTRILPEAGRAGTLVIPPGSERVNCSVNGQLSPDTRPARGAQAGMLELYMGWKTCHVELSWDGGATWRTAAAQRLETGSTEYRIDIGGWFLVQFMGATHFRLVGDYTDGPGGLVPYMHLIHHAVPRVPWALGSVQQYQPRHPRLRRVTYRTLGVVPGYGERDVQDYELDGDRELFVRAGALVQVSADEGVTYATLRDFGGAGANLVRRVLLHDSGELIVVALNAASGKDEFWRTSGGRANWTKVFEQNAEGNVSNQWGTSIHGDVVIVSRYLNKPVPVVATIVLSLDGGLTWTQIYANAAPNAATGTDRLHFHDVTFDPYRNIIWASTGDDHARGALFFRDVLHGAGEWVQAWEPGTSNTTQPTTIHPMPHCVLLGSDQAMFSGFHRLVPHLGYTPDQGTAGRAWTLENAYTMSRPGTWLEGTYRGHDFAHVGAMYAGVGNGRDYRFVGTRDGIRFYDLFSFPTPGLIQTSLGGHEGGRLLIQADQQGARTLAIADSPEWLPL